jgi:hypothetical protein
MGDERQLQNTLDNLQKSIDSMSKAASSQAAGTPQAQAEARRAEAGLQDAINSLSGVRTSQSKNQVEDLSAQADALANKQADMEGQMRKNFGPNSQPLDRAESQKRDANLAVQKEAEIADLKKLTAGMQQAARDMQATQPAASTKMREALSEIQQGDMERQMENSSTYVKRGLGEYMVMSEANITQGLNAVRDKLKEVQKAVGAPGKDGKGAGDGKDMEQTLANLEGLRQMYQAAGGRGQQGQPGQAGQGQQPGQQGQQQGQGQGQPQGQGQQPGQGKQGQQGQGQQPGQGQPGQSGQPGQGQGQQQAQGGQPGQPGGQQGGGANSGGSLGNGGNWNGGNYLGPNGRLNPQSPDYQTQYRQTLQSLQQLQQGLKGDPAMQKDITQLMQQMRELDPVAYGNDPVLAERIQAAIVANVEQVEMELRRKVEDTNGGNIRSPGSEKVPPGYSEATAEYFKKLSKSTTTGKDK